MKTAFIILILSILGASCSSKPKPSGGVLDQKVIKSTDESAQRDFSSAFSHLEGGNFSAAEDAFRSFGDKHPNDALSSVVSLYQLRAELKDFANVEEKSVRDLGALADLANQDSRIRWAAKAYQAMGLAHMGKNEDAIRVLSMYPSASLSPLVLERDKNEIWVLIASSLHQHRRFSDAFYAYSAIHESGSAVLKRFAIAKGFALAPQMEMKDLESMISQKDNRFVQTLASVVVLEKWLGEKRGLKKDTLLGFYQKIEPDLETYLAKDRGARILERISLLGPPRKRLVGVILPIKGANASIGKRTLDAIHFGMGAFDKGADNAKGQTIFVIANSNEDPNKVMQKFQEQGVAMVLGPLDRKRADLFGDAAESYDIPLLSLSLQNFNGDHSFRFGVDAKREVQRVVDLAIKNGDQKFAVLSSSTPYSKQMAIWFKEKVQEKGGTIVLEKTFKRKDKDFTKLAAITRKKRPDAIFIPETGKVVGNISAFMAHVDIWGIAINSRPDSKTARMGVHYLGTSLWYHESLVRQSSQYVKDAVIPVWSSRLFVSETSNQFYKNYRNKFGRNPSTLDAFAFDSAKIALNMIGKSSDSNTISEGLRTLQYEGVTGEIKGEKGRLVNRLRLLKVGRKRFLKVD